MLICFRGEVTDGPRAELVASWQLGGIPTAGILQEPVYKSSLCPEKASAFPALSWGRTEPLDLRNKYRCPNAERAAYHEAIWFPHYLFLGSKEDVDTIVEAIFKTLENIEELRGLEHPAIRNQRLSRADRES